MIITVSKDDETKTFEVPIEIEETNISFLDFVEVNLISSANLF